PTVLLDTVFVTHRMHCGAGELSELGVAVKKLNAGAAVGIRRRTLTLRVRDDLGVSRAIVQGVGAADERAASVIGVGCNRRLRSIAANSDRFQEVSISIENICRRYVVLLSCRSAFERVVVIECGCPLPVCLQLWAATAVFGPCI